jgi:quinoprotein glucose dehydrogenase
VFASGLRNPQELAFDAFGNLFTGDNDTAGDDPSRLIYVVESGDYGWRCSYQHQPGFGPWVKETIWAGDIDDVLPNAGLVAQGPSGLDYYPGTGMPERFKDHFLMCDFPGGIWSFTVKPKGAGFELEKRDKFVWNCWPTDVEFARDGGVFFSDWVAGWGPPGKGRIYRLFDSDAREDSLVMETRKLLAESFEAKSVDALLALLGHADQRVRLEAQFALAANLDPQTGVALLQTARGNGILIGRIHAIWAMAQIGRANRPLPQEFVALVDDQISEVRAQAARMIGELRETSGYLKLIPLLRDPEPRVRFFAAIAVGKLGDRKAVPALLGLLRENAGGDPFLRHAGVFALARIANGRVLAGLRLDPFLAVREAALLALRRRRDPAVASFLGDRDARLIYGAARAVNDVPIAEGLPALARMLSDETFASAFVGRQAWLEGTLRRAVNASFRVGTESEAARLAAFATNDAAPAVVRAEAIEALGDWVMPSPLDRVMGLWRPLPARDAAPARAAMARILARCLRDRSEPVQRAAISSAAKLNLREAGPAVFDLFQMSGTNVVLRGEILAALAALQDSRLVQAVQLVLADPNPALRREGLKWVGKTREPGAATMLEKLLEGDTDLRMNQTALAVLGTLSDPQADTVLARWMERLLAGKVRSQLQLDVLEAARQRKDGPLKDLIQQWEKLVVSADALAAWRPALEGGDSLAGRKIFMERADVSCLRCHALKGQGGIVGPALDHIGKARTREYLLEAMIFPNKAIASGFENVLVTMKNGANHAGLVKGETETELQLESPEDGPLKLAKADIASRQRGLSAMPEDLKQFLSPHDLRDLVEYLASLK